MKLGRSIYLLLLMASMSFQLAANNIDKGYLALSQYDYFKAKKCFTKGLKYNKSAAAQGLALIYFRQDNPFHSNDSALVYTQVALTEWYVTKERRRILYAKYGFTEDSILSLRQEISTRFFKQAISQQAVAPLTIFIAEHSWAKEIPRATEVRDSLAFFEAVKIDNSSAFLTYNQQYPASQYNDLAVENYNNLVFEETTGNDNLAGYVEFVNLHPGNPNFEIAEQKIYEIVTYPNTEESFDIFIRKYPNNSFVRQAWGELFQAYLSDYSRERIGRFLDLYPNFPDAQQVQSEYLIADSILLPCLQNDLYGFMNIRGGLTIPPIYSSVSFFSEGLNAIEINGKYGYVNKLGDLMIPCQFDAAREFLKGRAIVECNGKFGMIDRNGRFIVPCEYDDLGVMSDDLAYVNKEDKYGYVDYSGRLRIEMMYDDAYDFKEGKGKVQIDGKQGYVDPYGGFVVPPAYENVEPFYDTLYTFEDDGLYGLMNYKCQIFLEPIFSEIGQLSEGLAIAVLASNSEVVYIDSLGQIKLKGGFELFPNYLSVGEFYHGRTVVKKAGKFGRINAEGKLITPAVHENLGRGVDFFTFEKKGLWGLMNEFNEVMIKNEYESIEILAENLLVVSKNDSIGMLSTSGNILLPIAFKKINPLKGDYFIIENESGLALYNKNKIITDHKYKEIGLFNEQFVFLVDESGLSYYDFKTKNIIELR